MSHDDSTTISKTDIRESEIEISIEQTDNIKSINE